LKLPKTARHDPGALEAESCSFHGSWGHATVQCWALKRHLEDLVRRGHLDEFIFDSEVDPEVGEVSAEMVD